jgi:CHAP domain-containing protein
MGILSRNQALFAARLAARTRLNPRLIAGWLIHEEPAGARAPVGHEGDQNWLNIGNTDSKWFPGAGAWKDPISAADKTAAWLKGKYSVPGFGHAAPGIVNFSKTAGKPIGEQIRALQQSGWATSGYPDLPGIIQDNTGKFGLRGRIAPMAVGSSPGDDNAVARRAAKIANAPVTSTTREFTPSRSVVDRRGAIVEALLSTDPAAAASGRLDSSSSLLANIQNRISSGAYTTVTPESTRVTTVKERAAVRASLAGAREAKGRGAAAGQAGEGPARALQFADRRIGTSETGTNTGPKIDQWQRSFGTYGQPWCGIFVGKAMQAGGVQNVSPRVMATKDIVDLARARTGGFTGLVGEGDVRPGDVVVWNPGPSGHTGIVESVKGGKITTIEGNASDGVMRRVHPPSGAYYARPAYPGK